MRATILLYAIILTKAHRSVVSMAKGCIVARVLPLMCFLFFTTPNN